MNSKSSQAARQGRTESKHRTVRLTVRLFAALCCFFFAFGICTAPAFDTPTPSTGGASSSADEKDFGEKDSKEERCAREAVRGGGRPELDPTAATTPLATLPDPLRGLRARAPSTVPRTQASLDEIRGHQRPRLC